MAWTIKLKEKAEMTLIQQIKIQKYSTIGAWQKDKHLFPWQPDLEHWSRNFTCLLKLPSNLFKLQINTNSFQRLFGNYFIFSEESRDTEG